MEESVIYDLVDKFEDHISEKREEDISDCHLCQCILRQAHGAGSECKYQHLSESSCPDKGQEASQIAPGHQNAFAPFSHHDCVVRGKRQLVRSNTGAMAYTEQRYVHTVHYCSLTFPSLTGSKGAIHRHEASFACYTCAVPTVASTIVQTRSSTTHWPWNWSGESRCRRAWSGLRMKVSVLPVLAMPLE